MEHPAVEVRFVGEPKVFIQFGQFVKSGREMRWDSAAFFILTVVK
jgi:hypothetical protein